MKGFPGVRTVVERPHSRSYNMSNTRRFVRVNPNPPFLSALLYRRHTKYWCGGGFLPPNKYAYTLKYMRISLFLNLSPFWLKPFAQFTETIFF